MAEMTVTGKIKSVPYWKKNQFKIGDEVFWLYPWMDMRPFVNQVATVTYAVDGKFKSVVDLTIHISEYDRKRND